MNHPSYSNQFPFGRLTAVLLLLLVGLALAGPARAAGVFEPEATGIMTLEQMTIRHGNADGGSVSSSELGRLTITKFTEPDGGTNFSFTIDPGPYVFDFKWGTLNANPNPPPGTFDEPIGIAIYGDNVYVADTDNDRVQQFDAAGNFVRQWGGTGNGAGQFSLPWGIAVDADGRVYVADTENHRIQRFSSSGVYQTQWGGLGSGAGQFNRPYALAVAPDGSVYVADAFYHRIQKFSASGDFILAFGKDVVAGGGTGFELCLPTDPCQAGTSGDGNGEFNTPSGVAVDGDGHVYVVDSINHRIQKFDAGGGYVDQWGTQGNSDDQLFYPFGVAVDAADNVYVSDSGNGRMLKFDGDGNLLTKWGAPGENDGQFDSVRGVAVHSSGKVYTADTFNDRIQVFTPELSATLDDTQSIDFFLPLGEYRVSELVPDGWDVASIDCVQGEPATYDGATAVVTLSPALPDTTCTFTNSEEPAPPTRIYLSAAAAGTTGDGLAFGSEDIIQWDGSAWSMAFDGSAAGLTARRAVHNVNAFWLPETGDEVLITFTQNRRNVPGIPFPVDGMDVVHWNGSSFAFTFDGSDVGLTNLTAEKIDGLHVLDGAESPINGGACLSYLLVSTAGPGKVPNYSGGTLSFGGEDVLGFCATSLGTTTAGYWHMVLDGSVQGMPKNSTDSISLSADGQTLYLTTKGAFNVDSATGGHSMVYAYDFATQTFSGPLFSAAANGLPVKVDGLQYAATP